MRFALAAFLLQVDEPCGAGGEPPFDFLSVGRGVRASFGRGGERFTGERCGGLCGGCFTFRPLVFRAQRLKLCAQRFKFGLGGHGLGRHGGPRVMHGAAHRARRAVEQAGGEQRGGAVAPRGLRGGDGLVLRGHREPAFEGAGVFFPERFQPEAVRFLRLVQAAQAVARFLQRAFFLKYAGQRFGGAPACREVFLALFDARARLRLLLRGGLYVAVDPAQAGFRFKRLRIKPLFFPALFLLLPQGLEPALQRAARFLQRFDRRARGLGLGGVFLGRLQRRARRRALLFGGLQLGLKPGEFVRAVERGLRLSALRLRRVERFGERRFLRRKRLELHGKRVRAFGAVLLEQRPHPRLAGLPRPVDLIEPQLEPAGQRVPKLAAEERFEDFRLVGGACAQQAQKLALRQHDDLRKLLGGQ